MSNKLYILTALAVAPVLSLNAGAITFADANVRALCVANWDGDNDGELSTDEAAAVTSLGNVFRERSNIDSFDELKYFTGLTAINDYAFYKSSIRTVILPPTVATIGKYAFSQSGISGELCIPGTVKTIGDYAYDSCSSLTSVLLEEGVGSIGWHAFSGPIGTLSLPASLEFVSSLAINPYVNADPSSVVFMPKGDLFVYARGATPAAIDAFAFYYTFGYGHLVVPAGAVEAYKAAVGWSHFGEYLETGDVNGDGSIDIADIACLIAYLSHKVPQTFRQQAADFNGDGSIDSGDLEMLTQYILK